MKNIIGKYVGEHIPRYTSYPTAPCFHAGVGPGTYHEWLRNLPGSTTLSLYLHVPFCETLCWYCGCHTSVTRHREPIDRYVALLREEIDLVARRSSAHEVVHIHWGGGTPAVVGSDHFAAVTSQLRDRFNVVPGAEIAIEIDPRMLDEPMAAALGENGVTRASLGIQTFHPATQHAIGRVQSLDLTSHCAELLRSAGVHALNADLVYGLPLETAETCEATVETALTLKPSRFSVFGYAHLPAIHRHQNVIEPMTLPSPDERLRQEQAIGHAIVGAGYRRIGLDHYALPTDPLSTALEEGRLRRNFQGYSDDTADALIGLGASAIGKLPLGYVQNAPGIRQWGERIREGMLATSRGIALRPDDIVRATVIERLMCELRADLPAILARFSYPADWLDFELSKLVPLAAEGVVNVHAGVVTVPESARMLVRLVAGAFDDYRSSSEGRHAIAV